jgi:hypothetical protein
VNYLDSRLVRLGLILLVVGSGPLIVILIAARLGFGSDPNPNPVFFGMLAGLTFWPSIILILIGVWRARRSHD